MPPRKVYPLHRKRDVYNYMLKHDGESRWKELQHEFGKKGQKWSPTTLKDTLDGMHTDGTIGREARAGEQGPEIWYKLKSQLFPLRESSLRESSLREFQIFDMLVKGFSKVLAQQLVKTIADKNPGWLPPNAELTMAQIIGEIMKRAEGLKEKERELFLKQSIQAILKQATSDVLIMVRIETLLAKRAGPQLALLNFEYAYGDIIKNCMSEYLKCLEKFPHDYVLQVADTLMK